MTDAADVFAAFRSEIVSQTPLQERDHRRLSDRPSLSACRRS